MKMSMGNADFYKYQVHLIYAIYYVWIIKFIKDCFLASIFFHCQANSGCLSWVLSNFPKMSQEKYLVYTIVHERGESLGLDHKLEPWRLFFN